MEIQVQCRPSNGGWLCDVLLGSDRGATSHAVTVTDETLRRMAVGDSDPTRLVTQSFEFLLEREPRTSILRTFELPAIGRYFPEWEREMRGKLSPA